MRRSLLKNQPIHSFSADVLLWQGFYKAGGRGVLEAGLGRGFLNTLGGLSKLGTSALKSFS